ncbi:hypothetical protein FXO38_32593 [Capsicum annuum]|nr:hypothetical protein FXO38_32593 [Capsicum annuum]KAF3647856.1 hypothetical protein FXO37_19734 [Capsicum annuum]
MVALKKVRFDNFQPDSVRFMAREIAILCKLDHPNIMKLEGIITSRFWSCKFPKFKEQPTTDQLCGYIMARPPKLLLGSTSYGVIVDLWSVSCVVAELFFGRLFLKGRTEVEQLHKIFKLCGSPPGDYWKRYKLPLATMFKPSNHMTVFVGDIEAANSSHREFFKVWKKYRVLPKRCKYLYLFFDESFLLNQSYIFTTEGHPLLVRSNWHEKLPKAYNLSYESSIKLKRALNVNGEQNGGSITFAKDCKDD